MSDLGLADVTLVPVLLVLAVRLPVLVQEAVADLLLLFLGREDVVLVGVLLHREWSHSQHFLLEKIDGIFCYCLLLLFVIICQDLVRCGGLRRGRRVYHDLELLPGYSVKIVQLLVMK